MATKNLVMKLENDLYKKAEKASVLLGSKSITEYVARLIDENSTKVIAEHEKITVADDIFDRFMQACSNTKKPNSSLIKAIKFTQKSSIKI